MSPPNEADLRRREFARGMRDIAPAMPGAVAWGVVTGVAMVKFGLAVSAALGLSLTAYAGSAQLAVLPLLKDVTPVWIIAATAIITNLRFVIYSAALRSWFLDYSWWRRLWLGYLSGDFVVVAFTNRVATEGAFLHRDAYYFGMALTNWVLWHVASIIGIVGAAYIPTHWGLEFAGILALLALVVPLCREWPALAGALAAAVVAVLAHAWPLRLGMLAGVIIGITVAMWLDARKRSRSEIAQVNR
ncbi:MAG: AzlC family ABC transporter permease [Steroidobacteraceae bacterium]